MLAGRQSRRSISRTDDLSRDIHRPTVLQTSSIRESVMIVLVTLMRRLDCMLHSVNGIFTYGMNIAAR